VQITEELPPSYMMAIALRPDMPLLASPARARDADMLRGRTAATAAHVAGGPRARFAARLREEPPPLLSVADPRSGALGFAADIEDQEGRPSGGPYLSLTAGGGRVVGLLGLDGGDVFECADNQRCKDIAEQVRHWG
jgi:hypothetical protein